MYKGGQLGRLCRFRACIARSSDDGRPVLSLGVDLVSSFPAMRSTCSTARNGDAGQLRYLMPCMARARAATSRACEI